MKLLSLAWIMLAAFCIAPGTLKAADPSIQPLPAIIDKGVIMVTDGSSCYAFYAGGKFISRPYGESGRTIEGTWRKENNEASTFIIEGKWGWMNGFCFDNDYRRMNVTLGSGHFVPRSKDEQFAMGLFDIKEAFRCYFVINELVRLPGINPAATPVSRANEKSDVKEEKLISGNK